MRNDLLLLLLLWRRHRSRHLDNDVAEDYECDEMLGLLLLDKKRFVHSRNKKAFYRTLNFLQCQRRQRKIPTTALLDPHLSPWRRLYLSGHDGAMMTLTGLDHRSFLELNASFQVLYETHTSHSADGKTQVKKNKAGQRRLVSSMDCLGLALGWTRTRGSMFTLQMKFGLTGTTVSEYVKFENNAQFGPNRCCAESPLPSTPLAQSVKSCPRCPKGCESHRPSTKVLFSKQPC